MFCNPKIKIFRIIVTGRNKITSTRQQKLTERSDKVPNRVHIIADRHTDWGKFSFNLGQLDPQTVFII